MISPARRLLLLASAMLAGCAVALLYMMTDDARQAAACARSPGFLCGFGASMSTLVATMYLGGALPGALLLLGLSWWAAATPELPRSSLALRAGILFAVAAILGALAAAWAKGQPPACIERECIDRALLQMDITRGMPWLLAAAGALAIGALYVRVPRRRKRQP